MKRSGHHLVVDIIKEIYGNCIYKGNVSQKNIIIKDSHNKNIILSLEDIHNIKNFHVFPNKKLINVLVMRDPLNNYASRLKFMENTETNDEIKHLNTGWKKNIDINNFLNIFNEYFNEYQCITNKLENKITINYNNLIRSNTQPYELKKLHNKKIEYDFSKIITPHGSSFNNTNSPSDFLNRFKEYINDENMKILVSNKIIIDICKNLFDISL